ncbi:MAG: 4Fe-4S binding protein, partial [Adhaeribacter sp.]|nr:4Fe-4S binding protein [Adhaeribacter sp.]
MPTTDPSLAIGYNYKDQTDSLQKAGLTVFTLGLLLLLLPGLPVGSATGSVLFWAGMGLSLIGLLFYLVRTYQKSHPGVRNNGVWLRAASSRGNIAWITAVGLTGFYIILYWFPFLLEAQIRALDPLSQWLRNKPADHWLLYGTFYTLAILVMGFRALLKYRHSPYQV